MANTAKKKKKRRLFKANKLGLEKKAIQKITNISIFLVSEKSVIAENQGRIKALII